MLRGVWCRDSGRAGAILDFNFENDELQQGGGAGWRPQWRLKSGSHCVEKSIKPRPKCSSPKCSSHKVLVDQLRPGLSRLLPVDAQVRIPRAVGPVLEPVPPARLAMRYKDLGRAAKCAGEMGGRIAHSDDQVARAHQCGEPVDVVCIVDVVNVLNAHAEFLLD